MAKVIKLDYDMYSPEDLLNDTAEDINTIKSLMIVAEYEDGDMQIMHTGLSLSNMAIAAGLVNHELGSMIRDKGEDIS